MKNLTNLISSGFAKTIVLGIAATTMDAIASRPAQAANLSFTGNFTNANDLPSFIFTADGISTVTIKSFSYGGGTNANGTPISSGGFDLNLALFRESGVGVAERNDIAQPDNLDFNFSSILSAGNYQAIIFANGNYFDGEVEGSNLSRGFTNEGDFFGRTNAYAFDILNVNNTASTAVPEPSDLIGTVVAGFSVMMLKRKLGSSKKEPKI
jgi:hypothetical protein